MSLNLGGDEDLIARQTGGAKPFADLRLIAIHLRRVDMAIAELQRLRDGADAGRATHRPGAETESRNFNAFDRDRLHGFLDRRTAEAFPAASGQVK
jgi:hypothetical protein